MLEIDRSCLIVVDVQCKLAELMYAKDTLFKNIQILIKACKILSVPILYCQQTPQAIGVTVPQIANLLTDCQPINKATFSCCGDSQFNEKLIALDRRQILVCGIEAHVCIYQTSVDLIKKGFTVETIADAVSSRTVENKDIGLERMAAKGVIISSTEMALFELMRTAENPNFKELIKLIK